MKIRRETVPFPGVQGGVVTTVRSGCTGGEAASLNECFSLLVARRLRAWPRSSVGGTGEVTDATLKRGKREVFFNPKGETDRWIFNGVLLRVD